MLRKLVVTDRWSGFFADGRSPPPNDRGLAGRLSRPLHLKVRRVSLRCIRTTGRGRVWLPDLLAERLPS